MATKKQKPAVAKRVADRKAFVKDKVACFEYALNKALLEMMEEIK